MLITHERAQKLIQLDADKALNSQETSVLALHLQSCAECRSYASELEEVESLLRPLLKRQWSLQPIPLSTHAFTQKKRFKTNIRTLLATRNALVGAVFVMLVFSIWQFNLSGSSGPRPVGVPSIPTPATQSTSTRPAFEGCEMIPYQVQREDTLSGIADQFSVTEEEILTANKLEAQGIHSSMELLIPVCGPTPTLTLKPATHTTTHTPLMELTTLTPAGY